ncbi:MAG TPA: PEP-CTERM sorting domain-containing protein [Fimbriimonadaceae bacterium]|nr:PEP-CTERM sorting domain-containing protein [Fimbriimonadaceae bacterium]
MRNFRLLFTSSLILSAAVSRAALFTFHGLVSGKSQAVSINYAGNSMNVGAGLANVSLDGGPQFLGVCVDLDHWNGNGSSYQVNVRPIEDRGPFATRAAWLFNDQASSVNSNMKGAALQLAVWDIVYDNGDGLDAGSFKSSASGSLLTQTNSYLAASFGNTSSNANWFQAVSHGNANNRNQNYMGTVPEPSSIAVIAVGAFALLRRRRR